MKIEYTVVNDISRKPEYLELVLAAHIEMMNERQIDHGYGQSIVSEGQAIVATNQNHKVVGIITFYRLEGTQSLYISLSYVKPRWRKKGIWSGMRDCLRDYAVSNNYPYIYSGVFTSNKASIAANKNRGSEAVITFREHVFHHVRNFARYE